VEKKFFRVLAWFICGLFIGTYSNDSRRKIYQSDHSQDLDCSSILCTPLLRRVSSGEVRSLVRTFTVNWHIDLLSAWVSAAKSFSATFSS
jgi:hypothetical protein